MIEKLIENSKAQIDDILAQLRQIINSLNKFIKMYQADELDEVKLENFSYLNENDKIELLNLIKTLPKLDANVFSGQIKRIKEKINKIIDTIKGGTLLYIHGDDKTYASLSTFIKQDEAQKDRADI